MSSLRLTTALQQKMVLTPQLRQRIEMLQMTSLELSELIEQELVANPILEEVQPGDEVQEISDNILDQNANGAEEYENGAAAQSDTETGAAYDNGAESFVADTTPSFNGAEGAVADSVFDACGAPH